MNFKYFHIVFLVLCVPIVGISQGQTPRTSFYLDMGMKDATHELSLVNANLEDEKDFWADQKSFEALLKEKNPKGYQAYINGKYKVYRDYQILCGGVCSHSDDFSRHMAFYLINGESVGADEVVMELKQSKKKTY